MLKHFNKLKSGVLFKKIPQNMTFYTTWSSIQLYSIEEEIIFWFLISEIQMWIFFLCTSITSFLFTGPNLTHGISKHAMVKINDDLIVIGGKTVKYPSSTYSSYLNRLTFLNGELQWILLPQKLKIPRYEMVAAVIPDDFLDCSWRGWR